MIEVIEIDNNVLGIKTATAQDGQPIMWVYSYLIDGILFDAGCANASSEFTTVTNRYRPEALLITHTHEDHVGGCALIGSATDIYAIQQMHQSLKRPPQIGEFFRFVWGQPEAIEHVIDLTRVFESKNYCFEVVDLPGHCEYMIGFYEPARRWLISSDAVPLPSQKQIAMIDENVPRVIATMEKIQKMDVSVLFDGHRGAIPNPAQHIQKRIDFLRDLQNRVKSMYEQGMTVEQIVAALGFEAPWYLDLTERRFGIDYLVRSLLFDKE